MTTYTHNRQWAHGLGQKLGHAWRGFMRAERHAARWLETCGVPAGGAKALCWLANVALVAVILYAALWLGVLLLLAAGAGWAASNAGAGQEEPQTEWRHGPAGFGLYTSNDYRVDPHDPADE